MVRNEEEERQIIHRHIQKINSHPLWRQAHKIFIPENNLGLEASHLHGFVREFSDVTTFWQKNTRPGIVLTAELKNIYQKLMVACLFNRRILFERDLFTCSRQLNPQKILSLCREEFERFHWERKAARDNFGKESVTLTGKSGSKQDDCAMATLMVYKFGLDLTMNPRHEVYSNIATHIIRTQATIKEI